MDSTESAKLSTDDDDTCPAEQLLVLLRGRWTASLIHYLGSRGTTRFGVLQRALKGISPKVLTQRLRELERRGLVWREATSDVPPQVSYGLSEKGCEVHEALVSFEEPARRVLRTAE